MAIKCELCGNTEFVKEDGMFVCKGCNTSYSLEEAKKMMTDEEPSAAGTAAKDQSKMDNIKVLAERAGEQGDSKAAAKYYEQLMMEDPNNWEYYFYSTYYDAHNTTIAMIGEAANKVTNVLPTTVKLLEETDMNVVDKLTMYIRLSSKILNFRTMLLNNITPNLGSDPSYAAKNVRKWIVPIIYMDQTWCNQIFAVSKKQCYDNAQKKSLLEMIVIPLADFSIQIADSSKNMQGLYVEFSNLKKNMEDLKKSVKSEIKAIDKAEELKKQEEKRLAIEKYWEEHADEKKKLDDEQAGIEARIKDIKAQLKAIEDKNDPKIRDLKKEQAYKLPAENDVDAQKKVIKDLENERANCGFFKFKYKKELTEKIEQIEKPKLAALEKKAKEEKKAYVDGIDQQIAVLKNEGKELRDELTKCEKRSKEITKELTKDR